MQLIQINNPLHILTNANKSESEKLFCEMVKAHERDSECTLLTASSSFFLSFFLSFFFFPLSFLLVRVTLGLQQWARSIILSHHILDWSFKIIFFLNGNFSNSFLPGHNMRKTMYTLLLYFVKLICVCVFMVVWYERVRFMNNGPITWILKRGSRVYTVNVVWYEQAYIHEWLAHWTDFKEWELTDSW